MFALGTRASDALAFFTSFHNTAVSLCSGSLSLCSGQVIDDAMVSPLLPAGPGGGLTAVPSG